MIIQTITIKIVANERTVSKMNDGDLMELANDVEQAVESIDFAELIRNRLADTVVTDAVKIIVES